MESCTAEAIAKLNDFFIARVKNYCLTQGKETLLVEAVTAVDPDNVSGPSADVSAH